MRNGFAGGGRSRLSLRDRYAKAPEAALVPVKTVSRIPAFPAVGRRYAETSDTLHRFSRISAGSRLIRAGANARLGVGWVFARYGEVGSAQIFPLWRAGRPASRMSVTPNFAGRDRPDPQNWLPHSPALPVAYAIPDSGWSLRPETSSFVTQGERDDDDVT